jgi:hypothetical protein
MDRTDGFFQLRHICLIVPRLACNSSDEKPIDRKSCEAILTIERDDGLYRSTSATERAFKNGAKSDLGDGLGFVGLLSLIGSNALRFDPLSFSIIFIIRAKQINLFLLFFFLSRFLLGCRSSTRARTTVKLSSCFLVARKSMMLGFP